ncbi:unnamed protein product [Penicillium salamii]|nr:unnamed protein product [Penicillium salamii]CAG8330303.1 unnamed protein product [Penicillium salamii]
MPGVPTGRACDGCRKQKKKCDEKQPTCGRCLRLKLTCVGSGQQRYKFKQEHRFSSHSNQDQIIKFDSSSSSGKSTPPFEIPQTCPGNNITFLTGSFVGAIKRTNDLRYNLWWSFGIFLEEVPRRIGTNEALDRAVDALATAHASFCSRRSVSIEALSKYSSALKTLRIYLDDPIQAISSNTLCAVMILMLCQSFHGQNGRTITGHAQGASNILRARKHFGPRDEFEQKLFLSLRGSVLFEGLYNDAIDLSSEEWDALVINDFDQDHPEGRILRCLAKAPVLIKRGKQAKINMQDLRPLAKEVQPIYEECKLILKDLKARKVDCESSELGSNMATFITRLLQAHYLRTYGIGLAITLFFNCMLQALDPNNCIYSTESRSFVEETLLHAQESNMFRPVGAGYNLMCLAAAWAATTDSQLRLQVEASMLDYYGDFSINNRPYLYKHLEMARDNLWLGSPISTQS